MQLSKEEELLPVSHMRHCQQIRNRKLAELARRVGLDGLALAGDEEDLNFYDELQFENLVKDEQWYDRIRDTELRQLFRYGQINGDHDSKYAKFFNKSKRQRRRRKGSGQSKSSSESEQDLPLDFPDKSAKYKQKNSSAAGVGRKVKSHSRNVSSGYVDKTSHVEHGTSSNKDQKVGSFSCNFRDIFERF